jgi:hypothetical protein
LLCASEANVSFALDPATGHTVWNTAGGQLWRAAPHRLYSANRAGPDGGDGLTILDETTGRPLLPRQHSWRPVAPIEGARLPIIADTPSGSALAVLDARRLSSRRLALLPPGTGPGCWAGERFVTCRVGTDTFRAWRYSS